MSASNPSHLLISRNPRSPAHPQLAPTLTSRHSPSSSLPPHLLGSWDQSQRSYTHLDLALDEEGASQVRAGATVGAEQLVIHPTFHRDSPMPGRVRVIVGAHEFWCHKEILWFASPFFQGLLEGNWAETQQETSSVIVTSAGPSRRDSWATSSATDADSAPLSQVPEDGLDITLTQIMDIGSAEWGGLDDTASSYRNGSVYLDAREDGPSMSEILQELRGMPETAAEAPLSPVSEGEPLVTSPVHISNPSLLRPGSPRPLPPVTSNTLHSARSAPNSRWTRRRSHLRQSFSSVIRVTSRPVAQQTEDDRRWGARPDAVVELHEESASAFQDFLFWCYPHLECKVTWTNVENLLALASKLLTPPLKKRCEDFLLSHASGNPVVALMLAEQHFNSDLYREASRFVLDQPTWDREQMDALDEQTQLKLSQKRNWFLERLLKLGTIDVKREYACRPDCPDPAKCQVQLDEKWRQAHQAVCKYGPPQPSVAFRCLRQLEPFPTNPTLVMPHPLCQRAAQTWVMTLFDRMFQFKPVFTRFNPGTEKYWLWISLE